MLGAREGELTAAEAAALDQHLSTCARCRALARDFAAMDGLVAESLLARANARNFASFADEVMERVAPRAKQAPGRGAPAEPGLTFWGWIRGHRRAAAAALVPVLAAAALVVYVQVDTEAPREIALLEVSSEGEATTILQTSDGPVVLLMEENET
jgi:anti-sigma factor RsiW